MRDRIVQYPNRYRNKNTGQILDLVPEPGVVTEPGTPINKATLLSDVTAQMYNKADTVSKALQMAHNGDNHVVLVVDLTDPITGEAMPSGVPYNIDGKTYTTDGVKTQSVYLVPAGTIEINVEASTALPLGYKVGTKYVLLSEGEGVHFTAVFSAAALPITYALERSGTYKIAPFLLEKKADICLIAGGGGGGGASGSSQYSGGGGGGGNVISELGVAVASASLTVMVGAGGLGGGSDKNGGSGGNTTISGLTKSTAYGGTGGTAPKNSYSTGAGGSGGSGGASGSWKTTYYNGGSDGGDGAGQNCGVGVGYTTKPFYEASQPYAYGAGGGGGLSGTGGFYGGGSGNGGSGTQYGAGGAGSAHQTTAGYRAGDGYQGAVIIRFT